MSTKLSYHKDVERIHYQPSASSLKMPVPEAAGAVNMEVGPSASDVEVLLALPLDVFAVDCGPELLVCVGSSPPPLVVACRGNRTMAFRRRRSGELPHDPRLAQNSKAINAQSSGRPKCIINV